MTPRGERDSAIEADRVDAAGELVAKNTNSGETDRMVDAFDTVPDNAAHSHNKQELLMLGVDGLGFANFSDANQQLLGTPPLKAPAGGFRSGENSAADEIMSKK